MKEELDKFIKSRIENMGTIDIPSFAEGKSYKRGRIDMLQEFLVFLLELNENKTQ